MSERGSFVTEFIYCEKCFQSIKPILIKDGKFLKGVSIPSVGGGSGEIPIIAGKIGALYSGEELYDFEEEYSPEIAKVICHPLRVAVISDTGGEKFFTINPKATS